MTDWLWYDKVLGPRGLGAWIFVPAIGIFPWWASIGIRLVFFLNQPTPVKIIYSVFITVCLFFTVLSVIYITRSSRTAQRIHIREGRYCVHCYLFGRRFRFAASEVRGIQGFRLRLLNVPTFLSREDTNYRVYLANGSNFYLNGAVEGTEGLVADLEPHAGDGRLSAEGKPSSSA